MPMVTVGNKPPQPQSGFVQPSAHHQQQQQQHSAPPSSSKHEDEHNDNNNDNEHNDNEHNDEDEDDAPVAARTPTTPHLPNYVPPTPTPSLPHP
ncbi:hypothetical protein PILCRDRAFT_3326 [Piloderma croceum F 1598]|uniref:Uncharacterized protein n=1 Tax=Piloderma croceum (strain F 1598) TaxID=765440 RepID=A0A0C3FV58_PILCF|nr:hypothetical protein PILCRDRAFT_3326 [Piloderma croceum F 1598]